MATAATLREGQSVVNENERSGGVAAGWKKEKRQEPEEEGEELQPDRSQEPYLVLVLVWWKRVALEEKREELQLERGRGRSCSRRGGSWRRSEEEAAPEETGERPLAWRLGFARLVRFSLSLSFPSL